MHWCDRWRRAIGCPGGEVTPRPFPRLTFFAKSALSAAGAAAARLVAVAAALPEEAAAAKVREKHAAGEAPVLAPAASAPARRATQEKAVCIL